MVLVELECFDNKAGMISSEPIGWAVSGVRHTFTSHALFTPTFVQFLNFYRFLEETIDWHFYGVTRMTFTATYYQQQSYNAEG